MKNKVAKNTYTKLETWWNKLKYTFTAIHVYFKEITHQHSYTLSKNLACCDGTVIALLTDKCICGHKTNQRLVTLVTAAELAEAMSKQFTVASDGTLVHIPNSKG